MQFTLDITRPVTDLHVLEEAVLAVDPAAMIDLVHASANQVGATLRVASTLGADELSDVFTRAGYPVERGQLVGVPSVCCGGCSG